MNRLRENPTTAENTLQALPCYRRFNDCSVCARVCVRAHACVPQPNLSCRGCWYDWLKAGWASPHTSVCRHLIEVKIQTGLR